MMDELCDYSERWGQDFSLVQGAGGNTSVKIGDVLRVKASGFRLADARKHNIFVDVPMPVARAMARGGAAFADGEGRRASIETSLHAVMPHRVVAHLHMVSAIALAVRADAQALFADRLAGLRWGFVPYLKPGIAVAQAVEAILADAMVDVVVLANHGIVLAGDHFEDVAALVEEVRERLEVAPRRAIGSDPGERAAVAHRLDLEPVRFEEAHAMAIDPVSLDHATSGTLYPDHVVFLGRGAVRLHAEAIEHDGVGTGPSKLFLVPGKGAFVTPGLPIEAHEMAACLAEVVTRIPSDASIQSLSREDEDALIDWDAEIYRQNRAKTGS